MASRIILGRFSRNSAATLHRLISAQPEPQLFGSKLASSYQIKVPVKQFSSFPDLLEEKQKELEMMKNVLNRAKREAENSKKFAIQGFAKDLLGVADDLERASTVVKELFAQIDKKEGDKAIALLETFLESLETTNKQLSEVFSKFGVKKYDARNEMFDPHRHNAIFSVPDISKPGTVAAVIKNGYMLHERVLRPAEVGVRKLPSIL